MSPMVSATGFSRVMAIAVTTNAIAGAIRVLSMVSCSGLFDAPKFLNYQWLVAYSCHILSLADRRDRGMLLHRARQY